MTNVKEMDRGASARKLLKFMRSSDVSSHSHPRVRAERFSILKRDKSQTLPSCEAEQTIRVNLTLLRYNRNKAKQRRNSSNIFAFNLQAKHDLIERHEALSCDKEKFPIIKSLAFAHFTCSNESLWSFYLEY